MTYLSLWKTVKHVARIKRTGANTAAESNAALRSGSMGASREGVELKAR